MWSFRQFLVTRAVLGVGEGFNWPCATRIVANLLPPTDRGLGSGYFQQRRGGRFPHCPVHHHAHRGLLRLALGLTSVVANYTACMQDFSFAHVGIVAGINDMASNETAALVNPWIGHYVDHNGNYTLIFVLMAVQPAVSLGAILLFDTLMSRPHATGSTTQGTHLSPMDPHPDHP